MDCTLEVQPESVLGDLMEPAPGDLTESFPGDPVNSIPQDQLEDRRDSVPMSLNFGDLGKAIEQLITSLHDGDREYLMAFLSAYPAHTTMEQVLDVLFRR